MYVSAIHEVSDPATFWSGKLQLPAGTDLVAVIPSSDGRRGVCVFRSDSIDTVREIVDGATSAISTNEFYEINENDAHGLSA
jgi:hypothetical protein